jgi:hypothetical protein
MGINISILRVDKRIWEKEKLKSEIDRLNGTVSFLLATEFFDGTTSVYRLLIDVAEDFFSHKGMPLEYKKYPLLEGGEERDILLASNEFYELLDFFRSRIKHLKEIPEAPNNDNTIYSKYHPDPKRLLDFEEDIEEWIAIMESPPYLHKDYEYVITIS